jgi:hypothetical protein
MSTIGEALYSRLTTFAALSALIGARVYPGRLPVGATLPAVTYQRVSGRHEYAQTGPAGLARPRFQLDAWATTYAQADQVAAQVRAALSGYTGTVLGVPINGAFLDTEMDLWDAATETWHHTTDVFIWHAE